jgi:hypothetical protein
MMRAVRVTALLTACCASTFAQSAGSASIPADLNRAAIRLERTRCAKTCPAYEIEIRSDGTIIYTGKAFVAVEGEHRTFISPTLVRELIEAFGSADFFSLNPPKREVPALPTVSLSLQIGDQRHEAVYQKTRKTPETDVLETLERKIDTLADTEKWIHGTGATVRALRIEGWDFSTAASSEMLVRAGSNGNEAYLNALLEAGAGAKNERAKAAALINAAGRGEVDMVRALIAHGADPNLGNFTGLMAGAAAASPDVVEELLQFTLDVNARDSDGRTALQVIGQSAIGRDGEDAAAVVRLLVRAGADVNVADAAYGNTALHEALNAEMAKALIAAGAEVNKLNKDGQTPLMVTLDEGITRVLLGAGADIAVKDHRGKTALDLARELGLREKGELLERASKR